MINVNGFIKAMSSEMELAALWVMSGVETTPGKLQRRVTADDRVLIESGRLTEGLHGRGTNARIVGVFGNIAGSSLNLVVEMDSGEHEIISVL